MSEDDNSVIDIDIKNKVDLIKNNAIASCMAVIDIMHYLNGDINKINSLNKRIGMNNSEFRILEIPIALNKNCKYCGSNQNDNE